MNISNLASGFVFGVFGFWIVKQSKDRGNLKTALIGVTLLIFPYFIDNPYLNWGLGFGLLFSAYKLW